MSFSGTVKDAKGDPLEGFTVTDGRNLTKTDAEGRFTLPGWERARVISVCALTLRHDDWYMSADSKSFDFRLHPVKTEDDFCFLHTSDTEIDGREDCDWLDFVRKQVKKHSPAFIVHTGDICNMDGLTRHLYLLNKESAGCPVRYTIGNHDFSGPEYGEQTFERLYGPTWYSFDCGKMHFAVLSYGKGDVKSGYDIKDQWIWLKNDLEHFKPEALTILAHKYCQGGPEGSFVQITDGLEIPLREHNIKAWVFGHLHSNYAHEFDGVLELNTALPDQGGIESSEPGLRKVKINGTKVTTSMLYNCPAPKRGEDGIWKARVPGFIDAAPVLSDGRLYATSLDDGFPKKCGVTCLDEKTGGTVWRFLTEDSVKGGVALYKDKLFFEDTKCTLYTLEAKTGKLIKKQKLETSQPMYTRNAPIIAGGKLIAGNTKCVYALDPEDGRELWRFEATGSEPTSAGYVWDSFRNRVIVNSHWRALRSLDLSSSTMLWKRPETPVWFRSSTPLVTEKALYTCGYAWYTVVDPVTGDFIKTVDADCVTDAAGAPVLWEGVLYYPTGTGGVTAVDPETLATLRHYEAGPAKLTPVPYVHGPVQTVNGSPVIVDGKLIFASADGGLYVYSLKTHGLIKRTELGAPSLCSPVLTDDGVIAADFFGRITKFRL